jgi:hypothetical protein
LESGRLCLFDHHQAAATFSIARGTASRKDRITKQPMAKLTPGVPYAKKRLLIIKELGIKAE